ncbi:hypothetical protein ColTof4_03901 [Colletotrichum tofieldiae]|nr:hypothetical protein ColTof3_13748 [Colletotrichum tofieldiae]GKT71478.1 hypothetical protein ColTof4_03901 [Colletotrichum tofieldiae]
MHLLGTLVTYLLLAARCARAENRFRRPPGPGPAGDFRDNPSYALGSQLDLQWETDFESIDLLIWQEADYSPEPTYATIVSKTRSLGMLWTVSYNGFPSHHDPTKSPVYFIQMFKSGESVGNITSHYFNITESAATSTSPTDGAASTASSSPSWSATTGSPSSSAHAESSDGSVSRGAVAGIAVGVALGALLIAGLAGWIFWRRWQKNNAGGSRGAHEIVAPGGKEYYGGPVDSQVRFEVDGRGAMYEMPGEVEVGHDGNRMR